MPTIKITRRSVTDLKAAEKPVIYFDKDLKGFGIKVMPTGARSWILEYRPGAGGRAVAKKRIKIGSPDSMSPEDAREAATVTLARVTLGANPAAARADERASMSVKQVAEAYLRDHVTPKRKPKTLAEYSIVVNSYIIPKLGSMRASAVTTADVTRMQAAIVRGKADKANGGRTIANRTLAVLSAMFGWAGGQGLVPDGLNPVKRVERFKENRKERFLTSAELLALGNAMVEAETTGIPYQIDPTKAKSKHAAKAENRLTVYGPHVVAAIRLYLFTGARRREILDLTWSDVDIERGMLFLPDSKTGKKAVFLSGPAVDVLANLPRVGKYVIAGETAGQKDEMPRADLNRPWTAISKRAGLEGLRLHDLRHTFASIGAGGGQGLPVIGKLLGHTQAATTARYAHLDNDPLKRAVDAIGAHISDAMGRK